MRHNYCILEFFLQVFFLQRKNFFKLSKQAQFN